jgi:RimJ/RimL family protein N-acetyltransferase
MTTKPILLDVPESFDTERLTIRAPHFGDGALVNAAVAETFESLHQWMDWARRMPSVEESEEVVRIACSKFVAREEFLWRLFLNSTETLVGMSGIHPLDWSIPSFEIGYWCRKSFEAQGYITEAVKAITRFGFDVLNAERIIIRCDEQNTRSAAVARRAGYTLEGILRNEARTADGSRLRNTMLFAMIRADDAVTR